jgi:hypothetical protein
MHIRSHWIAIALLLLAVPDAHADRATSIAPFSVSYEVTFRGLNAGTASLTLQRENGDRWRYESRNEARGLFRLALPLQYRADDGTDSTDKDISLTFDHAAGKVTGVAGRTNLSLPIEAGAQDPMSVQIAVMQVLMLDQSPSRYTLVDKQEVKTYEYRSWGRERIATPIGPVETVIWSSARIGSNRVTKVWYAAQMGYIPVRAERRRGDKLEWTMNLKTLKSSAK